MTITNGTPSRRAVAGKAAAPEPNGRSNGHHGDPDLERPQLTLIVEHVDDDVAVHLVKRFKELRVPHAVRPATVRETDDGLRLPALHIDGGKTYESAKVIDAFLDRFQPQPQAAEPHDLAR